MKQLYYVNGKKVDFNTYANALNAEITAEETRKSRFILSIVFFIAPS